LQRRLESRSGRWSAHPPTAVEAVYLETLPLMETQPERAVERLQAMLDLYESASQMDEAQRQYLRLAARQLNRLKAQLGTQAAADLPLIEQQLAAARAVADTNPAQASRIYRALIQLYADKSWARDAVRTAQRELEQLK
jgi:hypothetical protein